MGFPCKQTEYGAIRKKQKAGLRIVVWIKFQRNMAEKYKAIHKIYIHHMLFLS